MKQILIAMMVLVAASAVAEITYPVDVENTRWAIIDTDSAEIIVRNSTWPVADGGPIVGLAPNLVMLMHVDEVVPAYDSRVFVLNSTEIVDVPNNELRKTHTAVRRDTEELLIVAENVESEQLAQIVQLQKEAIQTRLALGAVIKFALKGQTFPAKVQAIMDAYEDKAVKVWQNRDRLVELKASIQAGDDFDLDAGWVAP